MTLGDLISHYWDEAAWILVVLLGLIEFTPIKWNPLSWIFKKLGNALNADLLKDINKIDTTLQNHIDQNALDRATDLRVRILQFSDDLHLGINFSQSHFEQVILDITAYDHYCEEHPSYRNGLTTISSAYIKDTYNDKLKTHGFLQ